MTILPLLTALITVCFVASSVFSFSSSVSRFALDNRGIFIPYSLAVFRIKIVDTLSFPVSPSQAVLSYRELIIPVENICSFGESSSPFKLTTLWLSVSTSIYKLPSLMLVPLPYRGTDSYLISSNAFAQTSCYRWKKLKNATKLKTLRSVAKYCCKQKLTSTFGWTFIRNQSHGRIDWTCRNRTIRLCINSD